MGNKTIEKKPPRCKDHGLCLYLGYEKMERMKTTEELEKIYEKVSKKIKWIKINYTDSSSFSLCSIKKKSFGHRVNTINKKKIVEFLEKSIVKIEEDILNLKDEQ